LKILVVCIILASICFGDEIKRIESIVEDITKLRVQHKECTDLLANQVDHLDSEKQKVAILENQIKKYEKLLKIKEKEILELKSSKSKKTEPKKIIKEVYKEILVDKPNEFPKLVLKDKYIKQNIQKTEPSTYRLKNNAYIYDAVNGKKIEEWENGTSFTSNVKSESWVKITGLFVNKVWLKAKSNMWIKLKDVRKR
jgi:chromosome segregation ATPase